MRCKGVMVHVRGQCNIFNVWFWNCIQSLTTFQSSNLTKPRLITGAGGATARLSIPARLPVSTGSCRPLFLRVRQLHPARHVPDEEGKVTQQGQGSTSHYGLSDKIETRESLDLLDLDSTSFGAGRVLIFYLRKCFKNWKKNMTKLQYSQNILLDNNTSGFASCKQPMFVPCRGNTKTKESSLHNICS